MGTAAYAAAAEMLDPAQVTWAEDNGLWLVPLQRHLANAEMVGLARLRYRPQTAKTAAWWEKLNRQAETALQRYGAASQAA